MMLLVLRLLDAIKNNLEFYVVRIYSTRTVQTEACEQSCDLGHEVGLPLLQFTVDMTIMCQECRLRSRAHCAVRRWLGLREQGYFIKNCLSFLLSKSFPTIKTYENMRTSEGGMK